MTDKQEQYTSGLQDLAHARAENKRLIEVLEWYGEQARLCRLIHSEGDKGRNALADDGGKRARALLLTTS